MRETTNMVCWTGDRQKKKKKEGVRQHVLKGHIILWSEMTEVLHY